MGQGEGHGRDAQRFTEPQPTGIHCPARASDPATVRCVPCALENAFWWADARMPLRDPKTSDSLWHHPTLLTPYLCVSVRTHFLPSSHTTLKPSLAILKMRRLIPQFAARVDPIGDPLHQAVKADLGRPVLPAGLRRVTQQRIVRLRCPFQWESHPAGDRISLPGRGPIAFRDRPR